MKYTGGYIYPPRAENRILPDRIKDYNTGEYIAQPKYNGDAVILIYDGQKISVFNRHKGAYTKLKTDLSGIKNLLPDTGKKYVFAGEYLSKNKTGEGGKPINNVLIIWDILVWADNWLVGSTFSERADLIESVFPAQRLEVNEYGKLEGFIHMIKTAEPNIYRAPAYVGNFDSLYKELIQTDLYEGLVLKRADAKLQAGFAESNNAGWQIKVRKETNNYFF